MLWQSPPWPPSIVLCIAWCTGLDGAPSNRVFRPATCRRVDRVSHSKDSSTAQLETYPAQAQRQRMIVASAVTVSTHARQSATPPRRLHHPRPPRTDPATHPPTHTHTHAPTTHNPQPITPAELCGGRVSAESPWGREGMCSVGRCGSRHLLMQVDRRVAVSRHELNGRPNRQQFLDPLELQHPVLVPARGVDCARYCSAELRSQCHNLSKRKTKPALLV